MINTYDLLKKYNFSIQKKYGQNFLVDRNILEGIVDAAGITGEDLVLEIGPGLGALTQFLCARAKHVIAVEIDRMLIPILQETMQEFDNFTLVNQDILKTDIGQLVYAALQPGLPCSGDARLVQTADPAVSEKQQQTEEPEASVALNSAPAVKIKVVANLPYYITTPIVMALLEKNGSMAAGSDAKNYSKLTSGSTGLKKTEIELNDAEDADSDACDEAESKTVVIESITVMVQKEVAERMQEGVGTKAYGALSLAVQYYSRPEIALHVSKNCFVPKPDVDSAVIHLQIYAPAERPVKVADPDEMFKVIRAAFNQRRKTLVNSLSNAANLSYSKEQIQNAIRALGKPETVRGEALTLEEFALLTDLLREA